MALNSIEFCLFLVLSVLIYYAMPNKKRYLVLLIASYFFYATYNVVFLFWMLFSTISTYVCAILVDYDSVRKKLYVVTGIGINIIILLYFKYFNFIIDNVNYAINIFDLNFHISKRSILLPIAISYYTLQVIAYMVDVYNLKIVPEKNFFKYALFVSFFPKLISGPIEKPVSFFQNFGKDDKKAMINIYRGGLLFLFGIFIKMVVADRIAILANTVFDHFYIYESFELFIGLIAYSIQIYCDFNSYSLMALGMAKIFGYSITNNFNAPYFSKTIKEFWRRWHISLSQWLKEYIYIPLGGSRCNKLCKYRNILITFIVSGIWHGASWNFICWGGIHGLYQIVESVLEPYREKIEKHLKSTSVSYKLIQVISTYFLVSFAWLFFRTNDIADSILFIKRLFTRINIWAVFDGAIFNLGIDSKEMIVLVIGLAVVFMVDKILFYTGETFDLFIEKQILIFQVTCIVLLVVSVIVFGVYGEGYAESQFIYFQF